MATKQPLPIQLTDEEIDAFGRDMDAIYYETLASRGEKDRLYILRLIRTQRSLALGGRLVIYVALFFLPVWPHALAGWGAALVLLAIGTIMLGVAKILENMEIAHNVLHAQWDWMKDPEVQSNTWEWDTMSPSDRWMHSHNVVHHTWTNVVGKDLDVGYGIMRVTPMQPWQPKFLLQPVWFVLLMLLFEEGVALHEQALIDVVEGKKKHKEVLPLFKRIGAKVWGQVRKDYVLWPGLAALVAWPMSMFVDTSPLMVFLLVAGANAVANIIRNIWAFTIIFCGHFPDGVYSFTPEQVDGESRGQWYIRQLLGSANIKGGPLLHLMSGNLSHQIEHHLFPDMCSNRYVEVAPRVRALADRYGLPYNSASLWRQFGTTWRNNLRLAFPGGKLPPAIATA
ncbi:MAG: fatty acid desaturase family protein [Alcanivoracaceae bacterium]